MSMDYTKYLSVTKAAKACGMKRPNLSNLIAKGLGPEPFIVGDERYFAPEEVARWKKHYEDNIKRKKRNGA